MSQALRFWFPCFVTRHRISIAVITLDPLVEYDPVFVPDTPEYRALAGRIYESFSPQIEVTWATPFCPNIRLRNLGFAGGLVANGTPVRLQTKLPVAQLFRLLEYAYDLFRVPPDGLISVAKTEEIFESLADILAKQALARISHGLYREFMSRSDQLPYVRGRVDLAASLRGLGRGNTQLECCFSEHTADIWDNQIVLAALQRLRIFPFQRFDVERNVRKAYLSYSRQVDAFALPSLRNWANPKASYHRLNHEYRQLHALCRFFLDSIGPEHAEGDRVFIPYLISMPQLFEKYVAKWLEEHFGKEGGAVRGSSQSSWPVFTEGDISFRPDLVLSDREGSAFMVLDTKYKSPTYPSSDDVQQIVAYANHVGVRSAILIYPSEATCRCLFRSGEIEVRTCVFSLSQEPDLAGKLFLEQAGIEK
jgi:5-methylcytosine-specific restriction enzyme subunit McrC